MLFYGTGKADGSSILNLVADNGTSSRKRIMLIRRSPVRCVKRWVPVAASPPALA